MLLEQVGMMAQKIGKCFLEPPTASARRSDRANASGTGAEVFAAMNRERQNRTEQNRQKLKNRKNIQEQTKPYLQNKQLILACGSRARQWDMPP